MARRGYVQLVFQSTLPLRGATAYRFSIDETLIISIHTPLAGSDVCGRISVDGEFISIHTPLAGSDSQGRGTEGRGTISIHTPLAGSDSSPFQRQSPYSYFNPHSPCGERPMLSELVEKRLRFQSTLPLRGATYAIISNRHTILFQSTLPLRGATAYKNSNTERMKFQSTLPLRGATAEMRHF